MVCRNLADDAQVLVLLESDETESHLWPLSCAGQQTHAEQLFISIGRARAITEANACAMNASSVDNGEIDDPRWLLERGRGTRGGKGRRRARGWGWRGARRGSRSRKVVTFGIAVIGNGVQWRWEAVTFPRTLSNVDSVGVVVQKAYIFLHEVTPPKIPYQEPVKWIGDMEIGVAQLAAQREVGTVLALDDAFPSPAAARCGQTLVDLALVVQVVIGG